MDLMDSVRLVLKSRNCFPFLEYPLTTLPLVTKILSLLPPTGPPSSRRVIFWLGKVLNICCNRQSDNQIINMINSFTSMHLTLLYQGIFVVGNLNLLKLFGFAFTLSFLDSVRLQNPPDRGCAGIEKGTAGGRKAEHCAWISSAFFLYFFQTQT